MTDNWNSALVHCSPFMYVRCYACLIHDQNHHLLSTRNSDRHRVMIWRLNSRSDQFRLLDSSSRWCCQTRCKNACSIWNQSSWQFSNDDASYSSHLIHALLIYSLDNIAVSTYEWGEVCLVNLNQSASHRWNELDVNLQIQNISSTWMMIKRLVLQLFSHWFIPSCKQYIYDNSSFS